MTKDITRWGDQAMFGAAPMPKDEGGQVQPRVFLLWATPDPLGAVAAACRMYEGKPTRTLDVVSDKERLHYWSQVKRTHLKAPLEFVKLHFFIEGVTRAFTHQMVRQRTAVYAQESLRFAVKENMGAEVGLPATIAPTSVEADVWHGAMDDLESAYNYLINQGVPAEDARGLLPHAVTTRLHYCTDLRALLDHAGNRLCTQAQFEWRLVFAQLLQAIRQYSPDGEHSWQFEHLAADNQFAPVCYRLGHCPFDSVMDRQCSIRERVQRGAWEEITDTEWLVDPAAGRKGRSGGDS